MINNMNQFNTRISALEKRVTLLETEKDILTSMNLDLEERIGKLEQDSTDRFIESVDALKPGGTEDDD